MVSEAGSAPRAVIAAIAAMSIIVFMRGVNSATNRFGSRSVRFAADANDLPEGAGLTDEGQAVQLVRRMDGNETTVDASHTIPRPSCSNLASS